jgi:predicted amidohydrolase
MDRSFVNLIKGSDRCYNTHLTLDDKGSIRATYNKLHLFNLNYDEANTMNESKYIEAG